MGHGKIFSLLALDVGRSIPAEVFQGKMSRICFVVDSGTAIRNLLRTNVLTSLINDHLDDVSIYSPINDRQFKSELGGNEVEVLSFPQSKKTLSAKLLSSLACDCWALRHNLFTYINKRRALRGFALKKILIRILAGNLSPKNLLKLESKLKNMARNQSVVNDPSKLLDSNIDLLVYSTMFSPSHSLELAAEDLGIPTVAVIMSWDNLTTKGPLRLNPNSFIVWNDVMRTELIQYHGCDPEDIMVSGIPQFDLYANRDQLRSRRDFCEKWNLNPDHKIISYTTGTDQTSPFDEDLIWDLVEGIEKSVFDIKSQLVIRPHPKDSPSSYNQLAKHPCVTVQLPGRRGNSSDSWNPTQEDMVDLAELMLHSDTNVNVASTITLDAASFDTPIVNIAYDGSKRRPYNRSIARYYQYEHYRPITDSGGVKIAFSKEELWAETKHYLHNPSTDEEGRRIIREKMIGDLDGSSGLRIASFLSRISARLA